MKSIDLRKKTCEELMELLLKYKREKLNLRFQKVNGQIESTAELRKSKKLIARIMTIMKQKQNSAQFRS